jgi:hypothetical protein
MWRQVVVQMWPRGVAGRPADLPRLGSAGVRTARSAERHPRRTAPTCTSTCRYQPHPTPHRARFNRARSMQHATCTSARQCQLHADDDGAANHTEAMQPLWHARFMACLVCRMGRMAYVAGRVAASCLAYVVWSTLHGIWLPLTFATTGGSPARRHRAGRRRAFSRTCVCARRCHGSATKRCSGRTYPWGRYLRRLGGET